jgi:hypothetical protein
MSHPPITSEPDVRLYAAAIVEAMSQEGLLPHPALIICANLAARYGLRMGAGLVPGPGQNTTLAVPQVDVLEAVPHVKPYLKA